MDQNSGEGEPNNTGGSSQQCKQKYAEEEICGPKLIKGPDCSNKTVFNIGATPFISSHLPSSSSGSLLKQPNSSSSSKASSSHSDNGLLFPWNKCGGGGTDMATSTPLNSTAAANVLGPMKDIMELNNRLNSMRGLGTPANAIQSSVATPTTSTASAINALQQLPPKVKSIPSTVITSTPMPTNILRHLTNNNIMGNLLQETNPPPACRNGSDYRSYFNSDMHCLPNNGGGGGVNGQLIGQQTGPHFMHRAPSGGGGGGGGGVANHCSQLPGTCIPGAGVGHGKVAGNAAVNGIYNYRFDLENIRQRPQVGNAGNQFHHLRNVGLAPGSYDSHYGENHFMVTHSNGIIQLKLKDGIEIEMTLDGAIRVVNWRCNVSIALASSSNSAALIHPNGRVMQYHSRVEIMTYDGKNKNNFVRYAKIWYKGISFTSENNALVYLVDSGGTRTTTDTFMDLRNDITEQVFLNGSTHGPAYDNQANKEVMNHKYWPALDGTEVHELNGFRIAQTVDGMVRITKTNKNILVRTSPGNGSATLTTAYIHCTASLGQTSHLFVRRGERRMHFDGAEFVVRNSGHSAGFDSNNLLRVY